MAFCAGREDREFWGDDTYEDALFGSLDEPEELQAEQDDALFSVRSPVQPDALMQLDLVERLSWDVASSSDGEEEEEEDETPRLKLTLPEPLSIQVGDAAQGGAAVLQWSLISPCSDTASPQNSVTPTLSPLTRVSISSPVRQLRFFEPELEPSDEQVKTTEGVNDREVIEEEAEEEDEEVHPFDPETCWSPDENSVLSSAAATAAANPFATYQPPEPSEDEGSIDRSAGVVVSDGESDEQSNAASALRPSLLPRVPTMARWRRQKARTCSGAGSAGMPTALSLATFRARTRSLSRSRNQSVDNEDDGDFSSDDEGYTPELHRRRASETEPCGASQWRRARNSSMSFSSQRLSMNVRMSPAMMTKRLQEAKSKLGSGLHLLRSGSTSSTVMSDESFLDSPAFEEIKSAPAGIHREPSIFSDDATSTSLISATSVYDISTEPHQSRQQQLRAGVFKAAGMINAASAKLKSRAGSFRAPHLPKQKTAASETEEEDPEMATPPLPPVSAP
ncbi:uncharacterized protein IUM83_19103 [Phytophthora cinnamomi]|uniref:uncharacterized protein n=1 Tax=Phytophthora cinnamomi TaxID=4785 RepID=UPI00355A7633|nr:hypothetical protein IUM83_19103 [Phytophthora cinnamomi]